jgi:serine/threonine-protein kinase
MANSQYRILGEVGQGQFGRVYCACDRSTGQIFALKSLDLLRFPTRSFLKELAVLVRLNHPNVASFHGIEYIRQGRYIVMDYCAGGTLRQLMDAKVDLSLVQKLTLVQGILQGLEHIHQLHIIHCDLKPDNILLDVSHQGWHAKIADFGISHFLTSNSVTDSDGDTGSPAYMAPERFYGRYSVESDVYAIGVLLFELVTGWRPFSGLPIEVMKAHMNQPPRLPKFIPSLLQAVIQRALEKLPQHRYSSAVAMGCALETVIATLEHASPRQMQRARVAVATEEPTPPRVMQLQRTELQRQVYLDKTIERLWSRPQGCFIFSASGEMSLLSPTASLRTLGALSLGDSATAQSRRMDLDPQGRRLAVLQPQWCNNPSEEHHAATGGTAFLQVVCLPEWRVVRQTTHPTIGQYLYWANTRQFLIAHETETTPDGTVEQPSARGTQLQLWNRRGQPYWLYEIAVPLRQAVLTPTVPNRLLAIATGEEPAGLLIDLRPYKVRRFPLPICPQWVEATRWGYILVDTAGHLISLNRRGRLMAEANLPLEIGERVTAIAMTDPGLLWIALQQENQNVLYSIDFSVHLPKSLLRL